MRGDSRRGTRVNACKTLVSPKNTRSATRLIVASRFELPLLGSNQDSPDPESGVLPVTPRGSAPKITAFSAPRIPRRRERGRDLLETRGIIDGGRHAVLDAIGNLLDRAAEALPRPRGAPRPSPTARADSGWPATLMMSSVRPITHR